MSDDDYAYECVLPFDSDDPEFSRGVAIGMLWERLKAEPYRFRQQIQAENAEMVLRISEATGRAVRIISDVDDWLDVEFAEA